MEHTLVTCDLCPAPEASFVVRDDDGAYVLDDGSGDGPDPVVGLATVTFQDDESRTQLELCAGHLMTVRSVLGLAPLFVVLE